MAASGPKEGPKDAQVMAAILKDMGVSEYEPRLINQMLEFTYRYVTDVLDDAKVYSTHAGKKNIDVEDAKLAVQCKLDHSFTTPPPKDFLMDIAKHKNSTALPLIKPYTGPKLPPDRYCVTHPNYKLKSIKKQKVTAQPVMSTIAPTPRFAIQTGGGTATIKSAVPGQQLNLRPTQPTAIIRTAQPNPPMPLIRVNTGGVASSQPMTISTLDVSSLKRKREDDI